MIKFFIPLKKIPSKTAQQKGVRVCQGKPIFYTKPEVKAVEKLFRHHMAKHRPPNPLTGPIQLIVKWCYIPTGKHLPGEWKDTKPDTDNLLKLFKDSLEKENFFNNDSQVASEINQKFYNDICGVFVQLEKLT